MNKQQLMDASSRVAFAAYLHDLGKFAERAKLDVNQDKLDIHLQQYARRQEAGGEFWYSHRHAAWTALMWDIIESHLPELVGQNPQPFKGWNDIDVDDSIVNAAARHHKPETFLQWIVATADRVASGFEREQFARYNNAKDETKEEKNHFTSRQLSLFEQVKLAGNNKNKRSELVWRYKLAPLTVESLFPLKASGYETNDKKQAQQEYKKLWLAFTNALEQIPLSHRENWPLWLDHFDSAWACFTQSIPSATAFNTRPEVSLYDHSRTTSALATALWRYHHENRHDPEQIKKLLADYERPDWHDNKILLIQGDFAGIQNFIFATGGETQKSSARLLRGRSFYISLLSECAALKILDKLSLPPTSQVINAAGKFLIVAPNTTQTKEALSQVQKEFDDWFLRHTYGRSNIGFATIEASCNDFVSTSAHADSGFKQLIQQLFKQLEISKKQRFNLCGDKPTDIFNSFLDEFNNEMGVCRINGVSPASVTFDGNGYISQLAQDQITIGKNLTQFQRVLISSESLHHQTLGIPIFGYHIQFTKEQDVSGKFGAVAASGVLRRAWDIALPISKRDSLFNGYAKRYINAYVPKFGDQNEWEKGRYEGLLDEEREPHEPKTLEHIACDDRVPDEHGGYRSVAALVALKGDVDNLGLIFEKGTEKPTFTKMAALSRQMNAFFSIWLPWYCSQHEKYKSIYTVFAGGDDFFMIGPWKSTIELARDMRKYFHHYVAENEDVNFSAGLVMTKPGIPIRQIGEMAEQALDNAKDYPVHASVKLKNAVCCFNNTVNWDEFEKLLQITKSIGQYRQNLELSTGYLYGLQYLADMAQDINKTEQDKTHQPRLESALWNSRFSYRTWRMLEQKRSIPKQHQQQYQYELGELLGNNIKKYGSAFKIALFTHLYQYRK